MVAKTIYIIYISEFKKYKHHGDMIFIRGLIWNFFLASKITTAKLRDKMSKDV